MPRLRAIIASPLRLCVVLTVTLLLWTDIAPAQSYQIRPGDILRIEVLEDPALNRSVLVAPDGRISVPLAGSLRISGQPIEAVERLLISRLASGFANPPNVFVSIERLAERMPQQPKTPRMISIFVMGEALKPGMLDVPPGTNVFQAFAVMGGLTKFAAQKRIQLRRTNSNTGIQTIKPLNYRTIEAGSPDGRLVLEDGDVIVVPQRRLFE